VHALGIRRLLALGLVGLVGLMSAGTPVALAATGSSSSSVSSDLPGSTSPFSPGVPESSAPPTETATTPPVVNVTTSSSSSSSGLSGTGAIVIALGAVAVIAGIAFFIWNDSRRHAPHAAAAPDIGSGRSGSKAPPKSRKHSAAERKRRKRGKAR
jgi:hypothetical protein